MPKNNLDIAMLITDAILNEFEKNGRDSDGTFAKPKER